MPNAKKIPQVSYEEAGNHTQFTRLEPPFLSKGGDLPRSPVCRTGWARQRAGSSHLLLPGEGGQLHPGFS